MFIGRFDSHDLVSSFFVSSPRKTRSGTQRLPIVDLDAFGPVAHVLVQLDGKKFEPSAATRIET